MKIAILATICAIFCANGLFAQKAQTGRFSIGLGFGHTITLNSFEQKNVPFIAVKAENFKYDFVFFPLAVEYKVSNRISLMTGYIEPGFMTKWTYNLGPTRAKSDAKGLAPHTFPLFMYYDVFESEKHAFSAMIGFSYAFTHQGLGLGRNVDAQIASGQDFFEISRTTFTENQVNIHLGIRWSYMFAKKWHFQTNLNYNRGFWVYERFYFDYREKGQLYHHSIAQRGEYFALTFTVHRFFQFKTKK